MTEPTAPAAARDYSQTLFLPQTDFPMRAGLPQREPELLARWERLGLYRRLRQASAGRARFVLHDGPPYANGHIHIGHALNKILKDLVTRSRQMTGHDSNYVPGWDCHGLPIEWKIEEDYRAKGKTKDDVPVVEFRRQCRAFAQHWLDVQRAEFKRLGIEGDWDHPYSTMAFHAEAQIAREIMKFKDNGLLYQGSKPVMWSVVERTALADAEVEYQDYTSDMVWVKFPVKHAFAPGGWTGGTSGDQTAALEKPVLDDLERSSIVIWTTTPWTLPGNRAIAFSRRIAYALYEVTGNEREFGPKPGELYLLAKNLADAVAACAKITLALRRDIDPEWMEGLLCAHPLAGLADGYGFEVPLLDGDHVTDDVGTGFVHTAPGHGREDFDLWTSAETQQRLRGRGIDARIPFTVDDAGFYTGEAPGLAGKRVLTEKGEKGDANEAVIKELIARGMLVARERLKHQYPHSWRSKKPVIYRNTPQWFIAMDQPFALTPGGAEQRSLRRVALDAIAETQWIPASGENRITGMVMNKPDWVMSRQRAWGVPITVFVHEATRELLRDPLVDDAIVRAFAEEGGDAWFADGAKARFLAPFGYDPEAYEMVMDVLDVWFDSGSTHSYVLDNPAHFPALAGLGRKRDGGADAVMYLEGSDQHRGWFQSSLLESCGTRGFAPFDMVLTHGFVLDEKGEKMSKSRGNVTAPQDVIADNGADILRLWVAASDYTDDLRIGKEILKTFVETYRKLRNTLRWMLGTLAHFEAQAEADVSLALAQAPELERFMLHRLAELDREIRQAYEAFDFKRVVALLSAFMTGDLSAFYFDIRKDALYCDPYSSSRRRAALAVIDAIFRRVTIWLAPILPFTAEEAWLACFPSDSGSVHLELFPDTPADWHDAALAEKWAAIRRVRRVVTGALELERAGKRIGSSLEAAPDVFVKDDALRALLHSAEFADICITSAVTLSPGAGPADAFRLDDVLGVSVVVRRAPGRKCARSWRYSEEIGADPDFPDVTPRDAAALREWERRQDGAPAGA